MKLVGQHAALRHESFHRLELLQLISPVCLYTVSQCSKAPEFKPEEGLTRLWEKVGSTANLNCTALLLWDPSDKHCDITLQWQKDGQPLSNHTLYLQNTSSW